jgi:hypothetical protein
MFIDVFHYKNSKRHRRDMLIQDGKNQHAATQHATPMALPARSMSRFYKHFISSGMSIFDLKTNP